jgi:uncharacterized protein YijF (DUF1287 family)
MNRWSDQGRRGRRLVLTLLIIFGLAVGVGEWILHGPDRYYTAEELGIPVILSGHDGDNDGIDDSMDIMLGARSYIETKPIYKSVYYAGGYPNDGHGVCTDVIWQGLAAAGYDLKSMLDADVAANKELYGIETPDPNIDFRRVTNLLVFFERHGQSLPTDFSDPAAWQPGDIVVFPGHIGICSDRRNKDGIPFLIHHGNRIVGAVEKDQMARYEIIGHFRFVPQD